MFSSCNQRRYTCKVTAESICHNGHCVGDPHIVQDKCAGNSDKVVWNQVREQPQVGPLGQYWKKAFHYTITSTQSGKLVYHGRVVEKDCGGGAEDDLVNERNE